MVDRLLQHACRILGVVFPVRLIRFCECIGGVIGFFEAGGLDCSGFLEGLTGFTAAFLQSEGVGGLGVELDCVFVFFAFAAEEGEAAAGGGVRFFGLE